MNTAARRTREFEFTEKDFNFLRKISNDYTGIIVSDDKYDMYYARLAKRLRLLGLSSFSEYCQYLSDNQDKEFTEFINSITTNLTSFFRENHHFEYLASHIVPEIKEKNSSSRQMRIWSAGSSTGEEAYSIAITLSEHLDPVVWDIKILATDIDSNVLNTGKQGIYDIQRIENIALERKKRFFQRGKGNNASKIKVNSDLQKLIAFKRLNLIHEWPIKKRFDVIFCRNVIIYFDKPTKEGLLERFADHIVDGGYLVLGHSESIHGMSERFEVIGKTIYRKKVKHDID